MGYRKQIQNSSNVPHWRPSVIVRETQLGSASNASFVGRELSNSSPPISTTNKFHLLVQEEVDPVTSGDGLLDEVIPNSPGTHIRSGSSKNMGLNSPNIRTSSPGTLNPSLVADSGST